MSVAYVDPAAMPNNSACTFVAPCTKVSKALETRRPYIKFSGTTDEAVTIDSGRSVTLLADPGAKLTRSSGGAILTVRDDNTTLGIYDLTVADAPNPGGIGLLVPPSSGNPKISLVRATLDNNPGGGLSVAGGTLTIAQSTISGNQGGGIVVSGAALTISRSVISANSSGGIQMTTESVVSLLNNFIHHNGNDVASAFGALSLKPAVGSRVQFNTLVDNKANLGAASAGGIFCDISGFVADANIVFRNTGGASASVQTFGNCTYGNSFIMAAPAGDNTPQFLHPNTLPFDYHLTALTPTAIRDAAGACTGVDFDGQTRPVGAGCDLGADEYNP
jgi:hypothetical protein